MVTNEEERCFKLEREILFQCLDLLTSVFSFILSGTIVIAYIPILLTHPAKHLHLENEICTWNMKMDFEFNKRSRRLLIVVRRLRMR